MSRSFLVTPGRKFADGDLITAAGLNLLGTPNIEAQGQDGTDDQADESLPPIKTRFESETTLLSLVRALRTAGSLPVKDLVTKGPVADVRYFGAVGDGGTDDVEAINRAITAVIAAGGGTVLFPFGTFELRTFAATVGTIKAHLVANGTASIKFVSVGGGRLRSSVSPGAGNASAILLLQGALTDCVVDVRMENGAGAVVAYPTIGVYANDSGGALRNLTIAPGCHFRGLSRGIHGGADGLLVNGAVFSYPLGAPCNASGEVNVGVNAELTSTQMCARVRVVNCQWDGMEGTNAGGWRGADGLCRGTALGWTVSNNRVRHAWGSGIELSLRGNAAFGGLSWSGSPRANVIADNAIDFEDVAGEQTRIGRGILACEPNLTVTGNAVRQAHIGIELLNLDYNESDDTGTRMRDFVVGADNVITLAADLKLDDAASATANVRGGVLVAGFGAGSVAAQVRFLGRTSLLVTTKYWRVPAVELFYCDETVVSGCRISGPAGPLNTDLLWLAGVDIQGCRYCEVSGNYYRSLNIGTNVGSALLRNAPNGNEIGYDRHGASPVPAATENDTVLWAATSMDETQQGTLTPTTLVKKLSGFGTHSRHQRTSFVANATGWIRVASTIGYAWGRMRIWSNNASPITVDLNYVLGSGGALTGVMSLAVTTIDQVRVCTNNSTADARCHIDVHVGTASGQRVFVSLEGEFFNEGLWAEPTTPAGTLAGFTEANATLMATLTLGPGFSVSNGNWNESHLLLGGQHMWAPASGGLRYKASAPTSEGDGTGL